MLAGLVGFGCSGPGSSSGEATRTPLTVSAASSLTDAFEELADAFEAEAPTVEVTLNFGGSGTLAVQIAEGAPVDVFAPADPSHLDPAATEPGQEFATNRLRIVVPAGNPGGVEGLADLSRGELIVGLCAETVPCGDLARAALARAGVQAQVDSEEPNARALLTKVRLGEVDAALVYASDVRAAGSEVEGIDLPDEWNPTARYVIAVTRQAPDPEAARRFVAFVGSDRARAILARHGFDPPTGAAS